MFNYMNDHMSVDGIDGEFSCFLVYHKDKNTKVSFALTETQMRRFTDAFNERFPNSFVYHSDEHKWVYWDGSDHTYLFPNETTGMYFISDLNWCIYSSYLNQTIC